MKLQIDILLYSPSYAPGVNTASFYDIHFPACLSACSSDTGRTRVLEEAVIFPFYLDW